MNIIALRTSLSKIMKARGNAFNQICKEENLEIGLERHAEPRLQRALKVRLKEQFDLGACRPR